MLNVMIAMSMLSRPCDFPPPGASPECWTCYAQACVYYQASQDECAEIYPPGEDRQDCLHVAKLWYTADLSLCDCGVARSVQEGYEIWFGGSEEYANYLSSL